MSDNNLHIITNRRQLRFFIKADRIASQRVEFFSLKERLKDFIFPDYVMRYLKYMRFLNYYDYKSSKSSLYVFLKIYYEYRYKKLGIKLGFSIDCRAFSFGLFIPHYGTIVVGNGVKAGRYCVLFNSTCISSGNKNIGDALYLSSGAVINKDITLGNNCSISSNSVVNKSFGDNLCLAGMPADIVRNNYPAWYKRDGEYYFLLIDKIEQLYKKNNF